MGGGGNPTWIKYLEEKQDIKGFSSALISNIPKHIWMAARIKALTKEMKMNTVMIALIEKYAKDEIEV